MTYNGLKTNAVIWLALSFGVLHTLSAQGQPEPEPIDKEVKNTKENHPHSHHPYAPTDQKKGFEIDSWLIAEKFGWDLKETKQHLKNQDKFGNLVFKLENKHADTFAGSAMGSRPGEAATVWIKRKTQPQIKEMVQNFMNKSDMKVQIIDQMKYSIAEQERRMDLISDALEEKGFDGMGAALLPGDVILVSLPASEKFPETPMPKNPDNMKFDGNYLDPMSKKLLSEKIDPRGIYLTFTKQPIDVDEHARGGRQVSSSTAVCTSGFSVERLSDERHGIATAAHCTGIDTFDAESPEDDFDLFHRGEHCGNHGDVEWKSSNHFELAEYWASPTDLREVNSRETSYSVNNTYCVYSRMTGTRTCDLVYSTSVRQKGSKGACDGVKAKKLVAMDNDNTVGGDSGGPWSFNTEAAGIHKGDKWIWFGTRNTFTKASRLDEALGVRIRTQ